MIIVTTPMSKMILEIAGIESFNVNTFPDKEKGDFAILLSESKTKMDSMAIKLNTFSQIEESIIKVHDFAKKNQLTKVTNHDLQKRIDSEFNELDFNNWIYNDLKKKSQLKNSKIKIKVFSIFLKETLNDMGFDIVEYFDTRNISKSLSKLEDVNFFKNVDFIVFPDYLVDKSLKEKLIKKESEYNNINSFPKLIFVPSHKNVSKNPFIKLKERYNFLENNLKHH